MGRVKKGILSAIKGTVGTVIGAKWRGINYLRSLPEISNTAASPKQLAQRLKFSLAAKFHSTMLDVVTLGFQDYAVEMSGYNSAVSYTLDNAITGTDPNFSIVYADVLVSKGRLPKPKLVAATSTVADKVSFAWTDNSDKRKASATDKAILVVYCEELKETEFSLAGANRNTGTDSIDVADFKGKVVQTWMAFVSADGNMVSDSVFTGQLTVA